MSEMITTGETPQVDCHHIHPSTGRRCITKHCVTCGDLINTKAIVVPNCDNTHAEKMSRQNFCGICGTNLQSWTPQPS